MEMKMEDEDEDEDENEMPIINRSNEHQSQGERERVSPLIMIFCIRHSCIRTFKRSIPSNDRTIDQLTTNPSIYLIYLI